MGCGLGEAMEGWEEREGRKERKEEAKGDV